MSRSCRVVLREVVDADLPIFFAHQRDPESTRMAAFPARDHDAFFAHWAKIRRDPVNIIRTIVFEGEVAGNIGSWPAGRQASTCLLDRTRVLGPGHRHSRTRSIRSRSDTSSSPCFRSQAQRRLHPCLAEMSFHPARFCGNSGGGRCGRAAVRLAAVIRISL